MTGRRWLIGPAVALAIAWSGLPAAAAGPQATGQLVDRAGTALGAVTLEETADGVRLTVEARGLTPGRHGIHIHAVGACDGPDFASAGGHFNPANRKHGLNNPDGAHGGDLPNLEADAAGQARYTATSRLFGLGAGPLGLFDADGAALVIHAGPDDETTDPAGNSGGRVLCARLAPAPALPRAGAGGLADGHPAWLALVGLAGLGLAGVRWRRRAGTGRADP